MASLSSPEQHSIARRTLVLGGTRSGKSEYAENLAAQRNAVTYVATGRRDRGDADWEARIDAHRRRRPTGWRTIEASDQLASVLSDSGVDETTVVDDLGTWLTGAIDDGRAWDLPRGSVAPATDALVAAIAGCTGSIVVVSPEVGLSVVPDTRSGRLFQDEMGSLNSRVAAVCDTVVLVVAGIPLTIKDSPSSASGSQ